jgi:hypothetical protein
MHLLGGFMLFFVSLWTMMVVGDDVLVHDILTCMELMWLCASFLYHVIKVHFNVEFDVSS